MPPGHLWVLMPCAAAGSFGTQTTEIDPRNARYANDNLADDSIPVDTPSVTVILAARTAAAVCNAIYHATGMRAPKLPIRIADVLEG